MAKFEHKENSGSLFRNDKKEADSHPDYKGSALIDGTEHWVSGWINETSNGNKYLRVTFQPKDAPSGGGSGSGASKSNDDVGF